MEIGLSAGKDFAYLLGVYLGDGCVDLTKKGWLRFRLNAIDVDFIEATKLALVAVVDRKVWTGGPYTDQRSRANRRFYSLWCGHQPLCETLIDVTANKTRLPAFVFDWPRERQLALIAGLMDSEGFVAANSNPTNRRFYMGFKCCDPWVLEFARLLETVGIRIGKVATEEPRKPGYKAPTRFHIKMQSWVDAGGYFNISRKQRRVEQWCEAGAYERRATNPRRSTSETTRQTPAGPAMI
jgi:hypothetical protein